MELDGESFPNKYSKQSVPKQSLVINIDIINTVFYSWFIEISVFVSNFLSAYLNFPFQGLDPQSRRTTIGVGSTVALQHWWQRELGFIWRHLLCAGYWTWVQCQYDPGISANGTFDGMQNHRSFLVVFLVLLFILLISNRGFFYLLLKNINWKKDLKNFIPWKIWVYLDYRVWSNVPHPRKMKRPNWSSIFEMIIWLNSWRSAFKSFN